jgi:hypothetical protein
MPKPSWVLKGADLATAVHQRKTTRKLTAEALRAQSNEFSIKKHSDLRELCVSAVKACY